MGSFSKFTDAFVYKMVYSYAWGHVKQKQHQKEKKKAGGRISSVQKTVNKSRKEPGHLPKWLSAWEEEEKVVWKGLEN